MKLLYSLLLLLLLIPSLSFATIDVYVQDQDTEVVDLYLYRTIEEVNMTLDYTAGDQFVNITSTVAPTNTELLMFRERNGTQFFQSYIISATSLGGNEYEVKLGMPIDYDVSHTDFITLGSKNWAVDGSTTPVEFQITPAGMVEGYEWDITRLMMECTGDGVSGPDAKPDYTSFFVTDPITNGIYFQKVDGDFKNIFSARDNNDIVVRMYDLTINTNINRNGDYTAFARRTFNGPSKNGVVLRLDSTENSSFSLWVQDDLTDMTLCTAVAQGHVTNTEENKLQALSTDTENALYTALAILIGLAFVAVGFYLMNPALEVAGAIWFIINGVVLVTSTFYATAIFYFLVGIAILFHTIINLREK